MITFKDDINVNTEEKIKIILNTYEIEQKN